MMGACKELIQTGIICKKTPWYMRDSACMWLIVENAEIFRSNVTYFLHIF